MRNHDEQLLVCAIQEFLSRKHGDQIEVTNINKCFGGVINSVYFLDCLIQDEKEISETSLVLKIYCGKNVQEQCNQFSKDFYVYHLLTQHLDQQGIDNSLGNYVWSIEEKSDNVVWFLKNRIAIAKSLFPYALIWNLATEEQTNDEDVDVESFLSQYTFVIMTKVEGSPLNMMRRSEPSFKHIVYHQVRHQ